MADSSIDETSLLTTMRGAQTHRCAPGILRRPDADLSSSWSFFDGLDTKFSCDEASRGVYSPCQVLAVTWLAWIRVRWRPVRQMDGGNFTDKKVKHPGQRRRGHILPSVQEVANARDPATLGPWPRQRSGLLIPSQVCLLRPGPATMRLSVISPSRTTGNCMCTATGCLARFTTPRMLFRRLLSGPGEASRASKAGPSSALGSTRLRLTCA